MPMTDESAQIIFAGIRLAIKDLPIQNLTNFARMISPGMRYLKPETLTDEEWHAAIVNDITYRVTRLLQIEEKHTTLTQALKTVKEFV